MFIVIEGPDNVGKTTQVQRLAQVLEQEYSLDVVPTREPGGTEFGNDVRDLIMRYVGEISVKAQYCLFLADRAQHIKEVVDPTLGEQKVVISDRFDLSTIAYALATHELDPIEVNEMLQACGAIRSIDPDVAIILMPTGTYESEVLNGFDLIDYHDLRLCYHNAIGYVPYDCTILWVDNFSEEEVTEKIIEILEERGLL